MRLARSTPARPPHKGCAWLISERIRATLCADRDSPVILSVRCLETGLIAGVASAGISGLDGTA
jgi:hypothetical protein